MLSSLDLFRSGSIAIHVKLRKTWPAQSVTLTKEIQTSTELTIGDCSEQRKHPTTNTAIRQAPKLNHSSSQPKIEIFWSKQLQPNCHDQVATHDEIGLEKIFHIERWQLPSSNRPSEWSPKFLGRANNHLPRTNYPAPDRTTTTTTTSNYQNLDSKKSGCKNYQTRLQNDSKRLRSSSETPQTTTKHPKHL